MLSAAVAIVAIIYIVHHISSYFKQDMRVEPVQSAEITDAITVTGVIFRDETVVYGEKEGGVVRMYANGEKVGKNAVVARVYDALNTGSSELSKIDRKIEILTESNKINDTSIKNLDAKISRLYYTIRLKSEEGDFGTVTEKSEELLVLQNRREIIINARLNYNAEIAELREMRERIISDSVGEGVEVRTSVSGYFSGYVDGYENIFTASAAKTMQYDELAALLDKRAENTERTEDGYSVGKIALSPVWYLCAQTDRDTAYKLSEGKKYNISFPMASGDETEFTLERIVAENAGSGAVLVFSSDSVCRDVGSARKQTVSVTKERISGLRVPVSAIRTNDDGSIGVYILKNNRTTFRKIDIISEQDGYCIAREYSPEDEGYPEMLHKYDSMIVQGKGLSEQTREDDETTGYEIRIFG